MPPTGPDIVSSLPLPGFLAPLTRSQIALRFATGIVAVPLAVLVILVGGELLAAVMAFVLVIAIYELSAGMGLSRRDSVLYLTAAGVAAMTAAALVADIEIAWPLTAAALAVIAAPVVGELGLRRPQVDADGSEQVPVFAEMYRRSAVGIVGLIYIGWLGSYFVLLRELPQGEEWLLLAVFSVMATDTGAFVFGKTLGRHKLAARISPAKTVEGAVGGIFGGFTAVVLINLLPDLDVTYWKIALLGLALPIVAQLGDLTESVIKRALEVKDFSGLLPGHGGFLDRLDSLLFGVPTVYFFVRWIVL